MKARKKFAIFIISFMGYFFIGIIVDLACGPEIDPYDYYASFFHNTIQGNNNYQSFYFNGDLFLNDDKKPVTEADINSAEWGHHLGKGVSKNDIKEAMYQLSADADSLLLLKYLKPNRRLPDSLKRNTFLKALVSGNYNNDLRYYRFAKTTESLARIGITYRWMPQKIDSSLLVKKAYEALKDANAEKNNFIRLRYYYQGQRLMCYAGNHKQANTIYGQHIAVSKSKSHVIDWALSLKAGEESDIGNRAEAAFLFSKVFAVCPERRIQAFNDFNSLHQTPQNILKFAKTADEKAFVYAIVGFHTPRVSLKALEDAYKCQPKSPLIKLLLVREINKIEESYLSAKLDKTASHNPYSYGTPYVGEDSTVRKQAAYMPKLKAFCWRLANERKYTEPALGNIAIAYLSWMQDDNQGGFKAFSAIADKKLNRDLEDQKQLIKLLLIAQKIKKLDTLNEQELVPSLTWLDNKVKWENRTITKQDSNRYQGDYDLKNYAASSRDFYALVLAPAYLKQKDTAMAALAILNSQLTIKSVQKNWPEIAMGFNMPDFLQRKAHSYHLVKIIRWIKKPEKSAYLKLLTGKVNRNTIYNLYDLLGTSYLREHKYAKAVIAFNNIPANKSKHTPYTDWEKKTEHRFNPFVGLMGNNYSRETAKGCSKPLFAKQMAKLKKLIKTDPKHAARYYYTMANGIYNTSFYGKSWYLTAYTCASYDIGRKPENYYDADFLEVAYAKKYYLKAIKLSDNVEFKARCTFMAAKCQQIQEGFIRYDYKNKPGAVTNSYDYFVELKNHYSKTAFYKLAVEDCSYFRDFLASANTAK